MNARPHKNPARSPLQCRDHLLAEAKSPLREVFALLPQISLDSAGRIDLAASPKEAVRKIGVQARAAAAALSNGISAIGVLIPFAAPEFEDRTVGGDTVEALGWLLSELGVLSAALIEIALVCGLPTDLPNDRHEW